MNRGSLILRYFGLVGMIIIGVAVIFYFKGQPDPADKQNYDYIIANHRNVYENLIVDAPINDYIIYYNEDRLDIIERFVGTQCEATRYDVLFENMVMEYELNKGSNSYYVSVNNVNEDCFYDGVVVLEGPNEKFAVAVRMLPPNSWDIFELTLEDNINLYEYEYIGDFYQFVSDEMTNLNYYYEYEGLQDYEVRIVVDSEELTNQEVILLAEQTYYADVLYNNGSNITYYVILHDHSDSENNQAHDSHEFMAFQYKFVVHVTGNSCEVFNSDNQSIITLNFA